MYIVSMLNLCLLSIRSSTTGKHFHNTGNAYAVTLAYIARNPETTTEKTNSAAAAVQNLKTLNPKPQLPIPGLRI